MAISGDVGGGHGRKAINAEINLVPFIDLMSCLITFLINTAVWIEIGRIDVDNKVGVGSGEGEKPADEAMLSLTVRRDGFLVEAKWGIKNPDGTVTPQLTADPIRKTPVDTYDWDELKKKLKDLKTKFRAKTDILVKSEDKIEYSTFIQAMDECLVADFPNISVSGV
ncbi:MAG: biopolymer transporter ExbD [Deltaproteobacteria bacterium]|nr:biopolymer transporter ExbD [Deltaproteobacteria bacterium]